MPVRISDDDVYQTPVQTRGPLGRCCPSLVFHSRFIRRLLAASRLARRGQYDDARWAADSMGILNDLESVGVRFSIRGLKFVRDLDQPCLFVGNHMSSLETVVLPGFIAPHRPVTFVVKSSLLRLPVFGHVIQSRYPVVVDRKDPRIDFEILMREGVQRLANGTSLVVFPQHTRSRSFEPIQFNKIGIKLARRANVPIIPVALKTDAWQTGPCRCDFGRIRPDLNVHFVFGQPIQIRGRGHEEHRRICRFIARHQEEWAVAVHAESSTESWKHW